MLDETDTESVTSIDLEDGFIIDDSEDDNAENLDENASTNSTLSPRVSHPVEATAEADAWDEDLVADVKERVRSAVSENKHSENVTTSRKTVQPKSAGDSDSGLLKNECFSPDNSWAKLHLSRPLLKALVDLKFTVPTIVQKQAIPVALQGRDVLATAQTGSGKTAAFLLPILERLCRSEAVKKRRMTKEGPVGGGSATKALILLPTRELAVQCFEMLEALSRYTLVTKILVTGGLSQKVQESSFRRQPDIVVATPGRILDILLNTPSIHIELLEIVVLDEADRLLEMGFKQECLKILSQCSSGRQTLLFSATLSDAIKDLALLSLRRPIRVDVSTSHSLPSSLSQILVPIPSEASSDHSVFRESVLMYLCFEAYKKERMVVFFRTKKAAHRAALLFRLLGVQHAELHGNLTQAKRLEALETFHRCQSTRFLLCSELAARGLDIPHVDIVINMMVPPDAARYVHQAGRTARLGKKGTVLTLFSADEKLQLKRTVRQATKAQTSSVVKRTIDPEHYIKWQRKIQSLESDLERILAQERVEREIRLAEMEAQKGLNLHMYEDEILARPKKRWLSKTNQQEHQASEISDEQLRQCQKVVDSYDRVADQQRNDRLDEYEEQDDENAKPTTWDQQSDIDSGTDSSGVNSDAEAVDSYSQKPRGSSYRTPSLLALPAPPKNASSNRGVLSTAEKNRLRKERLALLKQRKMTPKQKAALRDQLPSKAIGSKLKKKDRPKRLRVTDDACDSDAGVDTFSRKRKRRNKSKSKKFRSRVSEH